MNPQTSAASAKVPVTRGQSQLAFLALLASLLAMVLVPTLMGLTAAQAEELHGVPKGLGVDIALFLGHTVLGSYWYLVLALLAGVQIAWARRSRTRMLAFMACLCAGVMAVSWFCINAHLRQAQIMQEHKRELSQ